MAGPRRALAQRHALGDLDDAERRQLAGSRIEERGAEPDQLLGGGRVGDGDQDPGRQRPAGAGHDRGAAAAALAGSWAEPSPEPFVARVDSSQRSTR